MAVCRPVAKLPEISGKESIAVRNISAIDQLPRTDYRFDLASHLALENKHFWGWNHGFPLDNPQMALEKLRKSP